MREGATGSTVLFTLAALACLVTGAAGAVKPGEGRTRVIRSWMEPATEAGQPVMHRITYTFDYDAGVFIRTVVDAAGRVRESKTFAPGEVDVRPSKDEIAEAFDRVRSEPEFARIIDRTGAQLVGGFVLNERKGACGPGTRCIHVQLNTADGWGIIRWAVVDLTKGTFAYRNYRPGIGGGQ